MGTIYLIRHGQASFDAEDYDNLSDLGRQQARLLGKALANRDIHVDSVYCGSLRRHRQTAESCLNAMDNIRPIRELALLNEYDHTEIITRHTPRYADHQVMRREMADSPQPWQNFQKFFTSAMQRWMDAQYHNDYRETWPEFQQRCSNALAQIIESTTPGQNVLVFTSGGPIATICQSLLELSDSKTLELNWGLVNTGTTKLLRTTKTCRLSVLNEHGHLDSSKNWITYR